MCKSCTVDANNWTLKTAILKEMYFMRIVALHDEGFSDAQISEFTEFRKNQVSNLVEMVVSL